jgi:hypothetical protein
MDSRATWTNLQLRSIRNETRTNCKNFESVGVDVRAVSAFCYEQRKTLE